MVEEPEAEEPSEGPEPKDGRLKRWGNGLNAIERILAAATAAVVGVGALIAAVLAVVHLIGPMDTPIASKSPAITQGGPLPPPPTTTSPSPLPSPSSTPSLSISVTCQMAGPVHEGQQTTATYTITSNQVIKVGLGMGIYDSDSTDYSTGDGDMDGYQLVVGKQTVKRDVVVPTQLPSDRIELDAEVWPNGKIGMEGVAVLAEATCGTFNAP